ncbi:uracil-DNA glycosylase [Nguyenibacter sp. L1]|uniref:uracil-DNA glycosylase n=1 Tax=Nguyenibacter sp. L1 TaxID=3049350 RepID=UPI002B46382B|nr:uracil-DNA glycosylase [Nguyenibacter sp. L1]WRH87316.1 uracil-DNA glycosylase [Nguyenibacter sp. L1]
MTDTLTLLQLYVEWGADVAFAERPTDWLNAPPPPSLLPSGLPPEPPSEPPSVPLRAHGPERRPPDDAPRPAGQQAHAIPPATAPARVPAHPMATPGRTGGGEDGLTVLDRAVRHAQQQAAAAPTLAALQAAIAAFGDCPLRDTATHTILPEGRTESGLLLIGEPPDAAEDRSGRPFAGQSGALLDRMLASVGLTRDDMLVAPVIPWRPPGERPPSAAELRICAPFLHRLIVLAAPRRVLLMGNTPTRLLTGEQGGIARLRGRWRAMTVPGSAEKLPVLPMRHPSQLTASAAARRDAWKDILLLRTTLDQDKQTP